MRSRGVMRALFAILTILLCTIFTAVAQTELEPQLGSELKAALSGNTLEGFYAEQDVTTGTSDYWETYHSDGTLTYFEPGLSDKGKWQVINNQLCHKYDVDPPEMEHCFYIYKENNCYYFFESLFKLTGQARHTDNWNNRSIIKGQAKTCEALIS